MNFSSLPSYYHVNIETPWEFIRSVFVWFWGIVTTDFIRYGNLSFSIFDVFIGFTILGIILRLVYTRMHLAAAVSNVSHPRRGRIVDDNGQSRYLANTRPMEK